MASRDSLAAIRVDSSPEIVIRTPHREGDGRIFVDSSPELLVLPHPGLLSGNSLARRPGGGELNPWSYFHQSPPTGNILGGAPPVIPVGTSPHSQGQGRTGPPCFSGLFRIRQFGSRCLSKLNMFKSSFRTVPGGSTTFSCGPRRVPSIVRGSWIKPEDRFFRMQSSCPMS